jgi:biotin transport system substrate-specific component
MNKKEDNQKRPRSLSTTPLRDWVAKQPLARRAGLVLLFSILIACGGKAGVVFSFTPVPATHQVFFVMLAGAILGSRLGTMSALCYLLAASCFGVLWPVGSTAAPMPMVGSLSGFLWSLPLVAFLSGFFVEKFASEKPVVFAMGVSAGIAAFDAFGTTRLVASMQVDVTEAFAKGAAFFLGQHFAHGALTVLIASTTSSTLQAREKK